ncbi:class I SAM-dependent DNA methyltransferase, partial [Bacillus sp. HC-Mk]
MGTEFNGLFDEWAHTYDSFVQGEDIQYKEVFAHYEDILEDVVNKSFGNVLEFGVGTGNLTNKLLLAGRTVYGIEPSREMRMIAKEKLPKEFSITEGDFLSFEVPNSIDAIVFKNSLHNWNTCIVFRLQIV